MVDPFSKSNYRKKTGNPIPLEHRKQEEQNNEYDEVIENARTHRQKLRRACSICNGVAAGRS